jgi:adenine-specific DNA-methyltransferase
MSDEKNLPGKVNLRSMDISNDNRGKLKSLFPSVFTETLNDRGEIVESIDFEKLKAELGTYSDLFERGRERYGMDWPGKRDCLKIIQQPSIATLKPCREESVNFDNTENLFIEGDNLEVLKLLQKSYYGKVKMIYIDPPYNTGNEFIYPDNYTESLDTYLEYAGLIDGEGRKFSTNTQNEGRFHTKWLNMMYPRLYLARNLLCEDGMIFISIDDNEASNLRKLCDEIFGEENFVAQHVWKKSYGGGAKSKQVVVLHEYVLMYAKSKELLGIIELPPNDDVLKYYKYRDGKYELRGPYRKQPLATKSMDDRPNLRFPILWNGFEIWPEKQWQWSKERVEFALNNDELVFNKRGDSWTVDYKQYLKNEEGEIRGSKLYTLMEGPYTQIGTGEIESLFGNGKVFTFPKPTGLIYHLSKTTENNDIIIDFFSGSGVTAHAVLNLNKEDGHNRKFIMIQLPEPCDEKSEAFRAGFKTIAEIGKERIRRVIKRIEKECIEKQQQEANKLPEMREELPKLDLGFKVLKLDKSNFKVWDGSNVDVAEHELGEQLDLFEDHLIQDSTQEDILFELLLKAGYMPTVKVEKKQMAGRIVFSIAEGSLLICLEKEITLELINAIAEAEPKQFICMDKGFKGNDQLKANAVQTFTARNRGREKAQEIIFRTV